MPAWRRWGLRTAAFVGALVAALLVAAAVQPEDGPGSKGRPTDADLARLAACLHSEGRDGEVVGRDVVVDLGGRSSLDHHEDREACEARLGFHRVPGDG